jgi:hypothetical protein
MHTILVVLSMLSELLPVFFALVYFSHLTKQLKWLFLFCIITVIFEVTGMVLGLKMIQTENLHQLYTFIQVNFIFWLYFLQFKARILKGIVLLFSCLSILIAVLTNFSNFFESIYIDLTGLTYGILIIILSNIYLFKVFTAESNTRLTNEPFFWINTACLLYFSTTLFLFIFEKHILSLTLNSFIIIWTIHLVSNILFNILISIGICRVNRI